MIETSKPVQIGWYVADLVVNVSAKLEGSILYWPANIQDGIYKAIETYDKKTRRKHELLRAICEYDVDQKWFVLVTIRAPRYGLMQ